MLNDPGRPVVLLPPVHVALPCSRSQLSCVSELGSQLHFSWKSARIISSLSLNTCANQAKLCMVLSFMPTVVASLFCSASNTDFCCGNVPVNNPWLMYIKSLLEILFVMYVIAKNTSRSVASEK